MNPPMHRVVRGSLVIAIAVLATYGAYAVGEALGVQSMRESALQRLEVYSDTLRSEMRRYDYLPAVLSLNDSLIAALDDPCDPVNIANANQYLETVAGEAKAAAVYVMNLQGLALASSNWAQRDSFVGKNFSFRPYFQDAVRGGLGRFYGVGTVSIQPGYYFASGIYREGRMAGVVAVKVSLQSFDSTLVNTGEIVFVADEHKVIFLSSVPALKFKALHPLSVDARGELHATRQYHTLRSIEPVGMQPSRRLADGRMAVRFVEAASTSPDEHSLKAEYMIQTRELSDTNWDLVMLLDLGPVNFAAFNAAAATGFASIAAIALLLYTMQRRRVTAERQTSKEALERAYGDLENQVALRTEDLRATNADLERESAERCKAEKALKDTLDELVQAGKMAALGQMATGLRHELNQPLAALRTLSDNATVLLQRGRVEDAHANLAHIAQLVERMSKIISQLKSFARKSPAELQPVALQRVIDDALFLMELRIRTERVDVRLDLPDEGAAAICDAIRLQQVLVNLIANALDAMKDTHLKRLGIRVRQSGNTVTLCVSDTGCGIPPAIRGRLFEPFFTTKPQGAGLGLGLAISAGIVKEFGGSVRSRKNHPRGTEFVVQMAAALQAEPAHA